MVNRQLVSTGYNGSMPGEDHCDDVGCMMEHDHCIRTTHAEANAVAQAARLGVPINGATAFITASPCWPCFKLLINAGIMTIIYGEEYREIPVAMRNAAAQLGVDLRSKGVN